MTHAAAFALGFAAAYLLIFWAFGVMGGGKSGIDAR